MRRHVALPGQGDHRCHLKPNLVIRPESVRRLKIAPVIQSEFARRLPGNHGLGYPESQWESPRIVAIRLVVVGQYGPRLALQPTTPAKQYDLKYRNAKQNQNDVDKALGALSHRNTTDVDAQQTGQKTQR